MERNTFVIEASEIPSKQYSITLQEPLFKDRRDAARRMPNNPDTNLGYTLEQLLLSMSIVSINGKLIAEDPKDPVSRIRYLPPEDTQFLLSVFIEAFTLNDDLANEAKRISEHYQKKTLSVCQIPASIMPTQSFSVNFQIPTTGHQIDVDRRYPGAGCGYSSEELLFAYCVTSINEKELREEDKPKQLITLLDEWTHIDVQFCMGVFLNLCFLTREGQSDAKNLGKQLRQNALQKQQSLEVISGPSTTAKTSKPTVKQDS